MTNRQYRHRRVTAQSTWKKSVASFADAWACRNCRQRVGHFWGDFRANYTAARRRISFSCSSVRFRFLSSRRLAAGHPQPPAVLDVRSFSHRCRHDLENPEVLSGLRQRSLALAGDRDHVLAELQGKRIRHLTILPARSKSLQARSQSTWGVPYRRLRFVRAGTRARF
jgi:hypothetical protein